MPLSVVILAAGQGKRMHSDLPKVLQPLAGQPLLQHVIRTARALHPANIYVVYGHGGAQVQAALRPEARRLGAAGRSAGHGPCRDAGHVRDSRRSHGAGAVRRRAADRHGLPEETDCDRRHGRARAAVGQSRRGGRLRAHRARCGRARERHRRAQRCEPGQLAHPRSQLRPAGRAGGAVAGVAAGSGQRQRAARVLPHRRGRGRGAAPSDRVDAVPAESAAEVMGVNDKMQLAQVEACYRQAARRGSHAGGRHAGRPGADRHSRRRRRRARRVHRRERGADRQSAAWRAGQDRAQLPDPRLDASAPIPRSSPNCVIDNAVVGEHCRIGPFARLRPATVLHRGVHIGNFVEIKNSEIGAGSKANHLSYVGDSRVGSDVNIGAGTITCNYDGANKWPTVIDDGAFIGSGSMLVAPVRIGAGATIGAGSTITENAPDEAHADTAASSHRREVGTPAQAQRRGARRPHRPDDQTPQGVIGRRSRRITGFRRAAKYLSCTPLSQFLYALAAPYAVWNEGGTQEEFMRFMEAEFDFADKNKDGESDPKELKHFQYLLSHPARAPG